MDSLCLAWTTPLLNDVSQVLLCEFILIVY